MTRFASAVHLTNPKTHIREFFLTGQEIPDWAHDQIGAHLIAPTQEVVADPVVEVPTPEELEEANKAKLEARAQAKAAIEAESAETIIVEEEEEDEDESDAVAEGYAGWTNVQLRDELINRSLPNTGKKNELIARLTEDDE